MAGEAVLKVTPNGGIQSSNFGSNSFQVQNTGTKAIARIEVDVTGALFPDTVFDPFAQAGDSISKPLSINANTGTGAIAPDANSYIGSGGAAGYEGVQILFDAAVDGGFEPGESMGFSIDMDPNSVVGTNAAQLEAGSSPAWDVGGVNGAELIGSTFTVTFTDGTTAVGQLQGVKDGPGLNSQGGAQALASQDVTGGTVDLTVNGLAPGGVGAYAVGGPQIIISGPAGATARVVVAKGFIQPFTPYNAQLEAQLDALAAEDFPANNAVEFQVIDIPLTGSPQDISDLFNFSGVPAAGVADADELPLGIVASIVDAQSGLATGPVTQPVYLAFDETLNSNPRAINDNGTTTGGSTTIDVLANDTDVNGDTLSIVSFTNGDDGTVTLDNGGTPGDPTDDKLVFTPDNGFVGQDSFTYTVSDGNGGTDTATVTVRDANLPSPPAGTDGYYLENNGVVKVQFEDIIGNTPGWVYQGAADGNNPGFEGTGYYYWQDELGTESFSTAYAGIFSTTFYIQTAGAYKLLVRSARDSNDPSDARNDIFVKIDDDIEPLIEPNIPVDSSNGFAKVFKDSGTTWAFARKFDADSGPNPFAVVNLTQGFHTISFAGRSQGFHIDSFQLALGSPNNSLTSSNFITGTPESTNTDPVAIDDSATTIAAPVTVDVLANDSDADGDPLAITSFSNGANGTVTLDNGGTPGDSTDDQLIYTPDTGFEGIDSFTYTVDDGEGGTDTATVTVTVEAPNTAPDAVDDGYSAAQDTLLSVAAAQGLLANDTDADGDTLSITEIDGAGVTFDTPTVLASGATLTVAADGSFTYDPEAGFTGADSFTYTVDDGQGGTDTATVSLTVEAGNVAPDAVDDSATTVAAPITIDVLANDSDANGDPLSLTGFTSGTNGSVALDNGGTPGDSTDDQLVYTPDAGFAGADSFTYDIADGQGGIDTATVTVTVEAAANTAPDAVEDGYTATEDTLLSVAAGLGLLANDTDADGDTLTITEIDGAGVTFDTPTVLASGATLTLAADGSFTYDPAAGFTGADSFTYTLDDGAGGTDTATVSLTVEADTSPPTGANGYYLEENGLVKVQFEDIVGNTPGWVYQNAANGNNPGFEGTGYYYWQEELGTGANSTADAGIFTTTVYIQSAGAYKLLVRGARDSDTPSSARNDIWVKIDDDIEPLIQAPGPVDSSNGFAKVFADSGTNWKFAQKFDSVSGPNPVAVVNLTEGFHTISFAGRDQGYHIDSFQLTTGSPDNSLTSSTFIPGEPTNTDPVAVDDSATTISAPIIIDVLANDTDADGDPLSLTGFTSGTNGTVTLDDGGTPGDQTDDQLVYTPDAGFVGDDSFTYDIADGQGGTDTATVTVAVEAPNTAPDAVDDGYSAAQDTLLSVAAAQGLLANDTDADGDILSITEIDGAGVTFDTPTVLASGATLTVAADGSFTYDPAAGFTGADSFTYTVDDGQGGTDTATVSLTVEAGNVAPDAVDDSATTISAPIIIDVLANDTDADGDPLSLTGFTSGTNGTVTLDDGGTPGDQTDDQLVYTPDAGFVGDDSFTYDIADGQGGTDTATVTVAVEAPNTAPDAVDDGYSAAQDTLLSVAAAQGLLANDTDADGDTLSITEIDGAGVTFDTPTVLASGATLTVAADGSFTYDPAAGFTGADSFTYTVDDGQGGTDTATVSLTVEAGNVAPDAVDDSATTISAPIIIDVLANDTDADGDPLSLTGFTSGTNGTVTLDDGGTPGDQTDDQLVYTPDAGFVGDDSFTYDIADGQGGTDTATVTVAVEAPNTAPDAVDDGYSAAQDTLLSVAAAQGLLANDTDADGDTLSITEIDGAGVTFDTPTVLASGATLTVAADGSFTYDPAAGFTGADSFTYTVDDGQGGTDTATVSLTVEAGNVAPDAVDDSATTISAPIIIDVLANDTDADGDPLSLTGFTSGTNGTVTLDDGGTPGDQTDDQLVYTPDAGFVGDDSFTYDIADGQGGTDTATVTVAVEAPNTAPDAVDDGYSAAQDTLLSVAAAQGLLANDTDADGDILSITEIDGAGVTFDTPTVLASGATLTVAADGSFTYDPAAGFTGADSFTYTVDDGQGGTDTATVSLTVEAGNVAPDAVDDSATTISAPIIIDVLANDTDADGDPLSLTGFTSGTNGTVTLDDGGTPGDQTDDQLVYTPDAGFVGDDSFTYDIADGQGGTDTATVTVAVEAPNTAPDAVDDGYSAAQDTLLSVAAAQGLLANDTDADGDTLSITEIDGAGVTFDTPTVLASGATLTVAADGSFTYDPAAGFTGADSFTYTVDDGQGGTDTATVSLTVEAGNVAPDAVDDSATTISAPIIIDVLANDTDADGDPLSLTGFTSGTNGTVTLDDGGTPGDQTDDQLVYTPDAGFVGDDSFTYDIADGQGGTDTATVTVAVEAPNTAPDAVDDGYSAAQDTLLSVAAAQGLLANDTDADGDTLSITEIDGAGVTFDTPTVLASGATLTVAADGSFTYDPAAGFTGADSFTYTVDDGQGGTDTATVSLTVEAGNVAPDAVDDSATTISAPIIIDVLANDTDADGDPLSLTGFTSGTNGTVTLDDGGTPGDQTDDQLVYTPDAGFVGDDSFTYDIADGQGGTDTATVTVAVEAPNTAPDAVDDGYSAAQDTLLSVAAAQGLLANDTDADGDTLSITEIDGAGVTFDTPTVLASGATLTVAADGSFTYDPAAGFTGADSFTYTVDDGQGGTDTATVSLTVEAGNVAPDAVDDSATTISAPIIIDVLANDTDADGDPLSLTGFTSGTNGTVTLDDGGTPGDQTDDQLVYTPDAGFVGDDSFTYDIADGQGGTDTATVTVAVEAPNTAPDAVDDGYSAAQDTLLSVAAAQGLLANDTDADGDTLSITEIDGAGVTFDTPTVLASGATLTVAADGSFTYDPAAGFTGADSFTYTVDDGQGGTDTATVSLTVEAGNVAPDAVDDSATTISAPIIIDVLANDTDADGDPLSLTGFTSGTNGTVTLDDGGTPGDQTDDQLVYTPDAGFVGDDSFTYDIADGQGGTDTATVTVAVEAPNTAPDAVDDGYSAAQDTLLSVAAAQGLLANDTDADGDTLSITEIDGAGVTFDTPTVLASGATLTVAADGSFTYDPAAGFTGADSFTYTVDDGQGGTDTATVSLTVEAGNVAPDAVDDSATTISAPIIIDVLANDTDADGDPLSLTGFTSGTNGTVTLDDGGTPGDQTDDQLVYTPDAGFVGDDSFTYDIADGQGGTDTATVTVAVEAPNTAPDAVDDGYSAAQDTLLSVAAAQGLLANDTDADGDTLSITEIDGAGVTFDTPTVLASGATLTVAADGSFTYDPAAGFTGADSFTYTVDDGQGGTDTATVSLTVEAGNVAPDAVDDSATTISAPIIIDVLANDTDADGDPLSLTGFTSGTNGTVTLDDGGTPGDQTDDQLVYTPDAGFVGDDSFTYDIADGQGGTDTATVTVAVEAPNTAPDAVDDGYSAAQDTLLSVAAAQGLLANDTDADGDTLSITEIDGAGVTFDTPTVLASGATLTVAADGSFTYDPAAGFTGADSFTYTVDDGQGGTDTATVSLTVEAGNVAPDAVDDSATTISAPIIIDVLANDTDADGDPLSLTGFTSGTNGTVTLDDGGTPGDQTDDQLVYTPDAGFVGDDSFTYDIADGQGGTDTATVTVAVEAPNTAPDAVDDGYSAAQDTLLSVAAAQGLLANDTDADGDILSITEIDGAGVTFDTPTVLASGATLTVAADGSFTYDPAAGFTGADSFTYTVDDGQGGTDTATVSLTVEAGNVAPDAVDDSATTISAPIIIDVLANDTDADGDPLSLTGFTSGTNGTVTLDDGGTPGDQTDDQLVYTPDAGFVGDDSFTYDIADGQGGTDTATVTVAVEAPNTAPDAVDDGYSAAQDTLLSVAAAQGLLANDTDADGDTLSITEIDGAGVTFDTPTVLASGATLTVAADGSFTYDPAAGFTGADSFTYTVDDGQGGTDTATVSLTVEAGNVAPDAVDDSATTISAPIIIDVLANDTDADGDPLSLTGFTSGTNGTVTLDDGGTPGDQTDDQLVYTPDAGFVGDDSFTYDIADGQGGTDTATVTVAVEAPNTAPDAVDDGYSAAQDTLLSVAVAQGLLANDTDADGDTLSITEIDGAGVTFDTPTVLASGATLTVAADGSFTYDPAAGFTGADSFTYTVDDGQGGTDTATVSLTVEAGNVAPDAVDDSATTISAPIIIDVLANDTDADGDPLSLTGFTSGTNGTVTLDDGGTPGDQTDDQLVYTPDAGFVGDDSFTYDIADGQGGTDTATVTVAVEAPNTAPDAVDDGYSAAQDTLLSVAAAQGLLANDTDADGDTLSITEIDGAGVTFDTPTVLASGATLTVAADGSFTYDPAAGFTGADSFTYTVDDGQGGTDTATVSLTVEAGNVAPDAVDDSATTISAPIIIDVLANDTDADGDPLSLTGFTSGTNGTVTLDDGGTPGDQTDDQLVYTPDAGFVGDDSFTYDIADGQGGTDTATVTVAVEAPNTAPDAVDDGYSAAQDTLLSVAAAQGLLANDTDADGDTLSITEIDGAGVTFDTPTVLASGATLTVAADGSFTYDPAAGFTGADSFTYTVDDGQGGTDTATVSLTVEAGNVAPDAVDDSATTISAPIIIDVLANDTDADGDPLSLTGFTSGTNGTVTLDDGGTPGDQTDDQLVYTPDAGFVGDDSFTYDIADGQGGTDTATVTVAVEAPNTAPDAVDDGYSAAQDTLLSVAAAQGLLANDTDADGDTLSITEIDGAGVTFDTPTVLASGATLTVAADGSFTYDPAAGFTGADSFTYTVDDGQGGTDTATVSLTVEAGNVAPDAVDDSATTISAPIIIDVLANDTDADGDPLSLTGFTSGTNGTVTLDDGGTPGDQTDDQLVYTPDAGFVGDDSFTYDIADGQGGTDTATVTVAVEAPNTAPDAVDDGYSAAQDTLLSVAAAQGLLANDTDADGDTLSITEIDGAGVTFDTPTVLASGATLTVAADGSFTYDPAAGFTGADSFTYTVDDGQGGTDTATVSLTVEAGNVAPDAVDDSATTISAPIIIDVLANDTDADGDPLSLTGFTSGTNGTVTLDDGGTPGDQTDDQLVYTPDAGFVGDDSFTYDIADGQGGTDTATVTVAVEAPNTAPDAVDDGYSAAQDTLLSVAAAQGLLANDTDADGDTLSITEIDGAGVTFDTPTVLASGATLTVAADGSFTYDPAAGFTGADSFTYTVDDGQGGTDTATVSLTVEAGNVAPDAVDDSATTISAPIIIDVLANDTDADGDPLSLTGFTSGTNGTVTLDDGGTPGDQTDDQLVYTPDAGFVGDDSFTYDIADGQGGTDTATVTVTVNDPPPAAFELYINAGGGNYVSTDGDTYVADTAYNVGGNAYSKSQPINNTDEVLLFQTERYGNFGYDIALANGLYEVVLDFAEIFHNAANKRVFDVLIEGQTEIDDLDIWSVAGGKNIAWSTSPILIEVSDGQLDIDFLTEKDNAKVSALSITSVGGAGNPPQVVGDNYTATEGIALSVDAASGVLANDTDPEGGPLTAEIATGPSNGTLALNLNGSFTYTPVANFSGTDSFTYWAKDEDNNLTQGTVTLVVEGVNDAPDAVNDSYTATINTDLVVAAAQGLLSNDTDPEGDSLGITAIDGNPFTFGVAVTLASGATVTLAADGSFTYEPIDDFTGSDSFSYTIDDGQGGTDTAIATINVAPPTPDFELYINAGGGNFPSSSGVTYVADTAYNVGGAAYSKSQPIAGTTDDPLYQTERYGNFGYDIALANGLYEVVLEFAEIFHTSANKRVFDVVIEDTIRLDNFDIWSVAGGTNIAYATTPIQVTVVDGQLDIDFVTEKDNAKVSALSITSVGGAGSPPQVGPDSYTATEGVALTVDVASGVLANDSDPEGGPLTAEVANGPSNGTLALNSDGSFTYTPAASFSGTDSFTYWARDDDDNLTQGTANITVEGDNDAPDAVADNYGTTRETQLTVAAAQGLLANDTDPEGDPLTITMVNGDPANVGTSFVLVSGATLTVTAAGGFSYNPANGFTGQDSFTYTASDGIETDATTVTIDVAPPPPEFELHVNAGGNLYSSTEGVAYVADTPYNVGGQKYSITQPIAGTLDDKLYQTERSGINFGYDIAVENGFYQIELDFAEIYHNAANKRVFDVLVEGSTRLDDLDVWVAAGGKNIAWTAAPFLVEVTDGQLDIDFVASVDQAKISAFSVISVDDTSNGPPVTVDDTYSVPEDGTLNIASAFGVLANDSDPDNDTLTAELIGGGTTNGTLTLNPNGSFVYTPNANFSGTDSFTYWAKDGKGFAIEGTATINVNPVNDAPVGVAESYATGFGTSLVVPVAQGVLANDTDADGDLLTVTAVQGAPGNVGDPVVLASGATVTLEADGSFIYDPAAGFSGPDSFTYTVGDGTANGGQTTVTIDVVPNEPSYQLHINAGGAAYAANSGIAYTADGFFTGGTAFGTGAAISGTIDDPLYQTERYGNFSYNINVENGVYSVVLDFAEVYHNAPNKRVFDVLIEGQTEIDDLDIWVEAGGKNVAWTATPILVDVNDGQLNIEFVGEIDSAKVSAISVTASDAGNNAPIANNDTATTPVSSIVNIDVLGNDIDFDGDALEIVSTGNQSTLGTVAINDAGTPGDTTDDYLTYTAGTVAGTDTFTYTISDGNGNTDTATVQVEVQPLDAVDFDAVTLTGIPNKSYTSLQFGPDGRLYASHRFGDLYAFEIEQQTDTSGKIIGYNATSVETITAIKTIQNHDDDGTLNTAVTSRQVTGILVTGTEENPVIYVTSSDPREGGGSGGGTGDTGLDTNSGVLSRLTFANGVWEKVDLVRGLPRSEENHSSNGMAFTTDPVTGHDVILLAQGGNTNSGAPSLNFAYSNETALSAAILQIDLTVLESETGAYTVKTDGPNQYVYDIPTVLGPTFGGMDGLNQARLIDGGPVSIYSSGWRNPYDIVVTEDGDIFSIDNGANNGWGGLPAGEGTANVSNDFPTNDPNGFNSVNNLDHLEYIPGPGYYAGHPNPIRANPTGAGLIYTDENGVETWVQSPSGAWPPIDPGLLFPEDGNFLLPGVEDNALETWQISTNGLAEYTASSFQGALQGSLITASFDSSIYRIDVSADNSSATKEAIASGLNGIPLDVVAQGDADPFPGTIWVAYVAGAADIEVLVPKVSQGTADDLDGDGYSNQDETDNGTNPNNSASKPADNDQDFVSDLNDDNDDNDQLLDLDDRFAIDAANGTTLFVSDSLDFINPLRNDDPGFGYAGLGFTGWMSNGTTDYLNQYDPDNLIAGGTAGIFTISQTTAGDARGGLNTQEYGFQFGITPTTTGPFLVKTGVLNVLAPLSAPDLDEDHFVGFQIGTGDQDNYVKMAVGVNALGALDIVLLHEQNGVVLQEIFMSETDVEIGDQVDLYLEIDPATGSILPGWKINGGIGETGTGVTVSGDVLDAIQGNYEVNGIDSAMAVGVMASSGTSDPFAAQYDYIEVFAGTLMDEFVLV